MGPCTHVGELDEAAGTWVQTCPASAIVVISGINQQMGVISLSFSLYSSAFQVKLTNLKQEETTITMINYI